MTRSVLVTGASKGIGAATAIGLAKEGFAAVVHYRSDGDGAARTCDAIREAAGTARSIQFDVVDREGSRAALEADIAANGAYYGVVSNAGIHRDRMFPLLRGEDWDAVIRTDLDGFYNVLHPCVMPMIEARRGGRIVAVSSVAGILGNSGQVNYSAAKAGLIGATKALALELAKRKITVNCIAPGFIDTGMTEGVDSERIVQTVPVRRLGKAEEVAGLIAYLMSDVAAYVTRQVIAIDGGLS
jgi:3-oxoacyl-[acyl-carrier protein] reductase